MIAMKEPEGNILYFGADSEIGVSCLILSKFSNEFFLCVPRDIQYADNGMLESIRIMRYHQNKSSLEKAENQRNSK